MRLKRDAAAGESGAYGRIEIRPVDRHGAAGRRDDQRSLCIPATRLRSAARSRQPKLGLIVPILVGPAGKIHAAAREHNLDIGKFELVDVAHSDAAAAKAVELIRAGRGELLMKGSLHTDELMRRCYRFERPACVRRGE